MCVCVYHAVPVLLQVSVAPERSMLGQLAADEDDLTFLHASTETQTSLSMNTAAVRAQL